MRKALTHALLIGFAVCTSTISLVAAANDASTQKSPTACSLITLDDAKALIGAAAKLDDYSKDDACSYSLDGANGKSNVTLMVFHELGKRWEDNKVSGEKIAGVGDEAYYEKMVVDWVSVIEVRKGDLLIDLTVRDHSATRDAMKNKEVVFFGKMMTRLAASPR